MIPVKNLSNRFWIVLAACFLILLAGGGRIFNNLELLTYDFRFKLRPPQPISKDILIIEIDDTTLSQLGQWPLPRDYHGSMVDALRQAGAGAVIFDFLFAEPSQQDALFAEEIKESGRVYLPIAFDLGEGPDRKSFLFDEINSLTDITPVLKQAGPAFGHINVAIDPDGNNRSVPLYIKHNGRYIPQIAFQAALLHLGLNPDRVEFKSDRLIIDKQLMIPAVGGNLLNVNYPARWKDGRPVEKWFEKGSVAHRENFQEIPKTADEQPHGFQHVSYYNILALFQDVADGNKPPEALAFLKSKICLIGWTATGTSDVGPTPLESGAPLVSLHAGVINSVLLGQFITDAGLAVNMFLNLCVFLLTLLICSRWPPGRALAGSLAVGLIYFLLAAGLFIFQGIWVDLFFPLFLIAAAYTGATVHRFLEEKRKRDLLEKELAIAQQIQQSFLPHDTHSLSGLSIASFFQPAKFVAGDLYDVIPFDENKTGIFIGDVSGKGVSAALIMAQTISLFRVWVRQIDNCKDLLNRLNKELYGKTGGRFITGLYLITDLKEGCVTAASAGQGPLLWYHEDTRQVEELDLQGNVPLGLMEDVVYNSVSFRPKTGDRIVIFSDGLIEARNAQTQEFGLERVQNIIRQNAGNSDKKILESLQDAVLLFSEQTTSHDDITVIVFSLNRQSNFIEKENHDTAVVSN